MLYLLHLCPTQNSLPKSSMCIKLQYVIIYWRAWQRNPHSNLPLVGRSRDWIPVKERFFAPVQAPLGPAQPPVQQAKQPGCGADCPLWSSAEVKGSIEQSLSDPSWPVLWWNFPFTFIITYWNISMICSSWCTRLQNYVFCDEVHRFYQDTLSFQNVLQFQAHAHIQFYLFP